jgi:hypothetical protein
MMMKMLEAGGMEILKDDLRRPDDDNPGGYYEFEPVKKTKEDPSWLEDACGKAVKMVSKLLYDLPVENHYKVLFMRRKTEEVLASQRKMLERREEHAEQEVDDAEIGRLFEAHLQKTERWLGEQKNFEVFYVNYNALMADPIPMLESVRRFLGMSLDTTAMAAMLDRSLYRQRK